jgi:chromosome segregation ATPase
MADSQPIKSQDVIQKDLFKPTITEANQLIDKLADVEKSFIDVLEAQEKILKQGKKGVFTADDLDDYNKALFKSNKTREELLKIQEAQTKLQKEINENVKKESGNLENLQITLEKLKKERKELNNLEKNQVITAKEAAKRRSELNVLIKATNKEITTATKEVLKESDAYSVLKDRTNKAQLELKKIAATFGINSKQAKLARKEFDKLDRELREINDAAKDGRRDVGRYEKALEGVEAKLGALLATAAGAAGAFQAVKSSLEANEQGSEDLRKTTGFLDGAFKSVQNTLGSFLSTGIQTFRELNEAPNISTFEALAFAVQAANAEISGIADRAVDAAEAQADAVEQKSE